eukprot:CAMPEP_0201596226 /NCGR_PEP_ID=MMETSP0190_2-20130828/192979_1 /ASSEMBLY_ACC=CAM_ASM_000263 /TAXON_ID=37353 /ORGANISM="Rosalina sp." /LENGTH=245 /DNA_ID=CAMNT_0048056499 /DNA_START=388 /DNA_END=1125 /DNA_ORIENTATION=+
MASISLPPPRKTRTKRNKNKVRSRSPSPFDNITQYDNLFDHEENMIPEKVTMDQITALPIPPQKKPNPKPLKKNHQNKKQVQIATMTNETSGDIKESPTASNAKPEPITAQIESMEDIDEHTSDEDIGDFLPSPPATVISKTRMRSKSNTKGNNNVTRSKKKKIKRGGSKHYHRKKQQHVKSKRKKNLNYRKNKENSNNDTNDDMLVFGSLNDTDWYQVVKSDSSDDDRNMTKEDSDKLDMLDSI